MTLPDLDEISDLDDVEENAAAWHAPRRGMSAGMHKGSCLCGSVRFTVTRDLEAAVACHCPQCRRQSGHYRACAKDYTSIALGAFDKPTGATLEKHIFVADKGDSYEIGDGLPPSQQ